MSYIWQKQWTFSVYIYLHKNILIPFNRYMIHSMFDLNLTTTIFKQLTNRKPKNDLIWIFYCFSLMFFYFVTNGINRVLKHLLAFLYCLLTKKKKKFQNILPKNSKEKNLFCRPADCIYLALLVNYVGLTLRWHTCVFLINGC